MELGTVEGAVNTEQFRFEAHRKVEKFDFVTVKANTDEAEWLLAQVNEVEKQPIEDDEKIENAHKTVASASIIGYRYQGLLKKPRSVIEPGSIVYQADQQVISDALGLDETGLYLGHLVTNPDINIFLEPDELYKHIAVLAKTGYGKSYATAVMIEELLDQDYPVLIIDPHGEYATLGEENDINEEDRQTYGINPSSFSIQEYSTNTELNQGAEHLSFSSKNLSAKEIQQAVPTNLTNSQLGVLYTALKELKERQDYTLQDVIDQCMNEESKAKWNLINMLEAVQNSGLFTDRPVELDQLIQKGTATIINLKGVDPENQEIAVYKLAKELFEKRKRGELEPFFMIIEEAHNYVPEKGMGKAVCSDILRKIASEGRKFGLGLGVISQRPANVAKNILSQCNTQLIMRVTNPNDLNAIAKSFEGVTSQVRDSITSLPTGTGLVLGKEYPIMTNIRTRKSQHGGETKELSSEESREESESAPEPANTAPPEEKEPGHMQTIQSLQPSLDEEGLPPGMDDVEKLYSPLWIVETKFGELAIDATDGTVKDRELNLTDEADQVLQALRQQPQEKDKLASHTGIAPSTLDVILERLQDFNLIEQDGDTYRYARQHLIDTERLQLEVSEESLLEQEISEDEAREIAEDELDGDIIDIELVYQPYYVSDDKIIDAVTGNNVN